MNRHKTLRRSMVWLVFQILLGAFFLTFLMMFLLAKLFPDTYMHWILRPLLLIAIALVVCTVVGNVLAFFLTKLYLRPINELMAATKAVAAGDYSVRVASQKRPVDITDIHSPRNEFDDFVDSFNKMAESLSSVEMLRTDFINTISHEFKTPVVSIRGFAKLLQNPHITEEQRKLYTDTIIQQSQELSTMSSNILLLSRYERTEALTGQILYPLDEQLRDAIRLQSKDWLDKDITLEGHLAAVTYYGNPDIMAHVWSNLLSNAIKFTPEKGSIHVCLTQEENTVTVRFRDNGIGMDENAISHIYEKFYQADPSRRSQGNGLGLSIVNRIVTLCGGTISVVSKPGEGTEFTIVLPREMPPEEKIDL